EVDDVVGVDVDDVVGVDVDVVVDAEVEVLEVDADEVSVFAGEVVSPLTDPVTGAVAVEAAPLTDETREEELSAKAVAAEIRPVPRATVVATTAMRNLKRTLTMRVLCTQSAESHN